MSRMGPRKDNFTREMDLKLIEFVKQHPELYTSQVELSTYHIKKEAKAYLWKEFAPTVGETPKACEKRWQAIKFRYLRTTANPGFTYEYLEKLKFIDKDIIRKYNTIERIAEFNSSNENGCEKNIEKKRKYATEYPETTATTSKMAIRTVQDNRRSAPFRFDMVDDILYSNISEENVYKTQYLNSLKNLKSEDSDEEIVVCIKVEQNDDIKSELEGAKIYDDSTAPDLCNVSYDGLKNECNTKESSYYEEKIETGAEFLNHSDMNLQASTPDEYEISYKFSNESVISHSNTTSNDIKIELQNSSF